MNLNADNKELVRWYYCSTLSSDVTRRRRLGGEGRLGDKYIFIPKVRIMDRYLSNGSIDDFFCNVEVRKMGLSRDGFNEFIEKLKRDRENYNERSFLEL